MNNSILLSQTSSKAQIEHMIKEIKNLLEQAKAQDIVVIDVYQKSSIADYLVIASGSSQRHLQSLSEKLKLYIQSITSRHVNIEGYNSSKWMLIDTGDIVIHLLQEQARLVYQLEKMW